MISNELRAALRAKTIPGDIPYAAQIYQKITSRKIHKSQLQKFLNSLYPFHNSRPGSHDPNQMYKAITLAVGERLEREMRATIEADKTFKQVITETIESNKLYKQILNDTKPQPIAL